MNRGVVIQNPDGTMAIGTENGRLPGRLTGGEVSATRRQRYANYFQSVADNLQRHADNIERYAERHAERHNLYDPFETERRQQRWDRGKVLIQAGVAGFMLQQAGNAAERALYWGSDRVTTAVGAYWWQTSKGNDKAATNASPEPTKKAMELAGPP